MSKKHDKDFLMSRKYATFVANEYAKRIEKAIEFIEQNLEGIGYVEVCDLLNILKGEDQDEQL